MTDSTGSPTFRHPALLPVVLALTLAALAALFWDGLEFMVGMWDREEYSHAWFIPAVAAYLAALSVPALGRVAAGARWPGVVLAVVALLLLMLGELSSLFIVIQYGLVVAIWAVIWVAGGSARLRYLWVPMAYLVFMVPLPSMLEQQLSGQLQLISSELGVAVIRLFGVSVFLEGNVIDLGIYKLQVAEACSGMRYLFPLMSFGFLCAALFRGPAWQRVLIFVSTVPLTVLMNSFRVGVIGVLVHHFGIEQAEGFLHDFEGWVVFMACVGVLFIEMWVFARLNGQSLMRIFALDVPDWRAVWQFVAGARLAPAVATVSGLFLAGALAAQFVTRPEPLIPERPQLVTFPLKIGDWSGEETPVDQVYLDVLQADDTLMALYARDGVPIPVQLWIAYYDTQTKGRAVHSPQACLPGGGWNIMTFGEHTIRDVTPDGDSLTVNRALVGQGDSRQLVYYWFPQRGRRLTSEYLVKWYIFWDGLTRRRSDGALVRLVTIVPDQSQIEDAERVLEGFVRDLDPQLSYYLPQDSALLTPAGKVAAD